MASISSRSAAGSSFHLGPSTEHLKCDGTPKGNTEARLELLWIPLLPEGFGDGAARGTWVFGFETTTAELTPGIPVPSSIRESEGLHLCVLDFVVSCLCCLMPGLVAR
jgi:hypothetical protein